MTMIVKNDGGTFELIPGGMKVARCYRIVSIGTQYNDKFQTKANKVIIYWEVPDERMKDGQPFSVSNFYTRSLHEKSNLRRDLESWRGRSFQEKEQIEGFDLQKLIDATCYINVIHNEKDGKTYANIAGITPLPKGVMCPPAVNEQLIFDIDENGFDQAIFDGLSERLQELIKRSDEYLCLMHGAGVASSTGNQEEPPPMSDEDIPPF